MDIAIFLQCSTIVCNGRGSLLIKPGSFAHILLYRWEILSYRSYAILADCIAHEQNPGLGDEGSLGSIPPGRTVV